MLEKLKKVYPESEIAFMQSIGSIAEEHGVSAYMVGGMPRDLLLEKYCADLDIVIEGDAIEFSRFIKSRWPDVFSAYGTPSKIISFKRYGTAKLKFSNEVFPGVDLLEFATARSEVYPAPGQPPLVTPATLSDDLARRDFSINAMAISLSSADFARLQDDFHGQRDLENGLLSVLHEKSFQDDPARLIRGLRLAVRLQFSFSEQTENLFQQAVSGGFLKSLPRPRCFDEFRKSLCESSVVEVIGCFEKLGLLEQIDPVLKLSNEVLDEVTRGISAKGESKPEMWECILVALYRPLGKSTFEKSLIGFELGGSTIKRLIEMI